MNVRSQTVWIEYSTTKNNQSWYPEKLKGGDHSLSKVFQYKLKPSYINWNAFKRHCVQVHAHFFQEFWKFFHWGLFHCGRQSIFPIFQAKPCKMEMNWWHIFNFPETKDTSDFPWMERNTSTYLCSITFCCNCYIRKY